MAKKTSAYWRDRALERESSYQSGSVETIATMQNVYDRAFDTIRKRLETAEKQFIKKGGNEAEDAQTYLYRMKSMEALQRSVYDECKKLENIEKKVTGKRYSDVMRQGYYHTMFDIQKGVGLAFNFAKLPDRAIKETMLAGWKGRNFSKSIWKNTEKVAAKSQEIIKAGFLSGASVLTMTEQLDEVMLAGKFAAERLIRSETNYFANQGELLSYKEADIEKYQYLATLDNRTSDYCKELDNKMFLVADAVVGENYPPMHAWCRSTTVAVFDDRTLDGIQRRARDPVTGKTYLVPADMNYKQWYDKYVIDNPEAEASFMMAKYKASDEKQFESYKKLLGDNAPKTFADFQELKYNNTNGWETLKDYKLSVSHGNMSPLVSITDYTAAIDLFNNELVGLRTSNGIDINSYSKHFIDRYFGSAEQRRSGVEIGDIKEALESPIRLDPVANNINGKSQRFFGKKAIVTLNPDAGRLIQVNPNKRRR